MNNYYLELIRQSPIDYNGLIFYPISFQYICDTIGLEVFNKILMPFLITKDCVEIPEYLYDTTDLFEDIILKDEGMLSCVVLIIQLFCKSDNIAISENSIIVITEYDNEEKQFSITKENFYEIADIIRKISSKDIIKVEKPPKNMTERQRDIWDKLQVGRKKAESKNEVHIYDMLNVCEFGGNYRIPEEEIEQWTLWKIANCYKARIGMKTYDDNLKICLVSGDGKPISGDNHWHQQLMVGK